MLLTALVYASMSVIVIWIGNLILHELREIANHLDTRTAGGLRDVVDALQGKDPSGPGHG